MRWDEMVKDKMNWCETDGLCDEKDMERKTEGK